MKKLLCFALCFITIFGLSACSSGDGEKKNDKQEQETKQESDLDIISKTFTLETADVNGTTMGRVKEGETLKFSMYISFSDKDKEMSQALGIEEGEVIFHLNGDDSETYLVNLNKVFITATNTTPDSMKESMDTYLKEKGITIDQLKTAMKEKFN